MDLSPFVVQESGHSSSQSERSDVAVTCVDSMATGAPTWTDPTTFNTKNEIKLN